MKRALAFILALLLALGVLPAMAQTAAIQGAVARIDHYGHAVLDFTLEDLRKAGFEPGDIVTLTAGSFTGDVPVFTGYYVDRGECMVRAIAKNNMVTLCVNYGSFGDMADVDAGDAVTLVMKEKGGALELEEINNLDYSDDRADFSSDAVFANFRAVAEGKLYRSASPVDNCIHRAAYADALIREAGVRTVMNLASTPEDIEGFMAEADYASPYYRELYESGRVIALGLAIDFASDAFAEGIVKGFSFLAEGETPYLVHCVEGKDRAGFAAMLLEALMGWSAEDITADYMVSYANYYGIQPGTARYDLIVEKNIDVMLRTVAGLAPDASLADVDLQAAAEAFLIAHGMSGETLKLLETKLMSE